MSIKVTPEIRQALRMLIDDWGSALEIQRRTHVANSTISRYLSGHLPRMNDSTWNALAPHLLPYIQNMENTAELPVTVPLPPADIFRRILYDGELSNDDRVKFLRLIGPPEASAASEKDVES